MRIHSEIIQRSFRSYAVGGMVAVLTIGGLLAIFSLGPRAAREWASVQGLEALDREAYEAQNEGSPVLFSGDLEGNPEHQGGDLVAYVAQRPDLIEDGATLSIGSKSPGLQLASNLRLRVDGQHLSIGQVDTVAWSGDLRDVTLRLDDSGVVDKSGGETVWVLGFRDGDLVTVLGYKGADGELVARWIHGGDCDSLLAGLRKGIWTAYGLGAAFILAAVLLLLQGAKGQPKEGALGRRASLTGSREEGDGLVRNAQEVTQKHHLADPAAF